MTFLILRTVFTYDNKITLKGGDPLWNLFYITVLFDFEWMKGHHNDIQCTQLTSSCERKA